MLLLLLFLLFAMCAKITDGENNGNGNGLMVGDEANSGSFVVGSDEVLDV
jgi:hypothetical protein